MKRQTLKNVLSVTCVILMFAVVLMLVTRLLQPKYMDALVEGSLLSQYYEEAGGHDVIFVGDCEVYANFSPLEMFRSQGITAYVRGSSQQLIWQTYHVLEETLSYEVPRVVVYNVNAMRYGEPVSEAYNRLTIDRMKWSKEKVDIILDSMTEEESFLSYVFPILRYHSRFDELTAEDVRYLFTEKRTAWNGHLINQTVSPLGNLPAKRPLPDYQFPDICYEYLDRIRQLCEDRGVELILIKAPSVYPYWYDEYDAQILEYARIHGLRYYNFLDHVDEVGIDYSRDTYDGGMHLNLSGAVKLSNYFAEILVENHGVQDRRTDPAFFQEYRELLEQYDQEIEKQR